MSIKSLLQVILLLLIFIILGGLYFIYFYSGPLQNKYSQEEIFKIDENNKIENNVIDGEILEEGNSNNQKNSIKIETSQIKENLNKNLDIDNQKKNRNVKLDNNLNTIKNITKDIEYITTNNNGDIFKIIAKFGRTDKKNNDILKLESVDGIITSNKRSEIKIKSNFAEYNYSNQNSKFYGNVNIGYDDKIIKCDNLDLNISDNIAVGYNNVIIVDNNSTMKAQNIIINILTKDIRINSKDYIEFKSK